MTQPPKKENVLLNLVCNIVVPTIVLMKFSSDRWLGPLWGLVVALSFPLAYGIYDLIVRRKTNLLSVLGLISVLVSGSLGLMKVGGMWFAVKEAALPLIIGAAVLLSLRTKNPLVRDLLLNDTVVDVAKVNAALDARGTRGHFDRLLRNASLWLALSFVGMALVNFLLARYILRSPPATTRFNEELGRMNMLTWPLIVLPSMVVMMVIFWRVMKSLCSLTGLTSDELFHAEKSKN